MAARQPSHITSHQASRERARDIERRRGRDRARRRREFGGRKLCWQYYISRQPSPTAHINVVRHSEVMSISHKWQGRWRCGIQQWFLKAIVIYNGEHYEQMSPKKNHTHMIGWVAYCTVQTQQGLITLQRDHLKQTHMHEDTSCKGIPCENACTYTHIRMPYGLICGMPLWENIWALIWRWEGGSVSVCVCVHKSCVNQHDHQKYITG